MYVCMYVCMYNYSGREAITLGSASITSQFYFTFCISDLNMFDIKFGYYLIDIGLNSLPSLPCFMPHQTLLLYGFTCIVSV